MYSFPSDSELATDKLKRKVKRKALYEALC